MRPIKRLGGHVANQAGGLGLRFHQQKHAADIGMIQNGAHALALMPCSPSLLALFRVRQGLLERAIRNAHPFNAHRQTRGIHHREHASKPAVFFADQIADRAPFITEYHRAGGRGMDAQFMLDTVAV